MYKTIIFLATLAVVYGFPADQDDGVLGLVDAKPADETKSVPEQCFSGGKQGVCTPYFICKVQSDIIIPAPDDIMAEEKLCSDYLDVCCPDPKEE